MNQQSHPRPSPFTLRKLMLVTLVFLLVLVWFVNRRYRSQREWAAVKALQSNVLNQLEFKNQVAVGVNLLTRALGIDLPSPLLAISSTLSRDGDALTRQLTKTPSVQQVRIVGSEVITEKGMQSLATLPQLKVLFLSLDKNDGEGLRHFSKCPTLERLYLSSCEEVTQENTRHLLRIPNLKHLSLKGIAVSDDLLEVIGRMPLLTELDLSESLLTDEMLSKLKGHPTLTHVNIRDTQVTDAGIVMLMSLPELQQLDVCGLPTAEASIDLFYKHPKLKVVRVSGDRSMENLVKTSRKSQPDHPLTISFTPEFFKQKQ